MNRIQDFFIDIIQKDTVTSQSHSPTGESLFIGEDNLIQKTAGVGCYPIYCNGLEDDVTYTLTMYTSTSFPVTYSEETANQWNFCLHVSDIMYDSTNYTSAKSFLHFNAKNYNYKRETTSDNLYKHTWTFTTDNIGDYKNCSVCIHTSTNNDNFAITNLSLTTNGGSSEATTEINNEYIRLTSFVNGEQNKFGTFDEKLTIKENSQQQFTFSIYEKVGNYYNPFVQYLKNDRLIKLTYNNKIYHFVITNVAPTVTKNNVKYTYTCQDEFSYVLTRRNVGMNFTTDDSEDYEDYVYAGIWGSEDNCGPKSINELLTKLFEVCNITDWVLDPTINTTRYPFPNSLYDDETTSLKVSLSLTGSTPYAIIVEIAKLFNAIIDIDYSTVPHVIDFINKDYINYNGFQLRPDFNLNAFNYSEKGDSLYNIMHVSGGTDADDNLVSIVPTIPTELAAFLLNNISEKNDSYVYPLSTTNPIDYKIYCKKINTDVYYYYYGTGTGTDTFICQNKLWTELTNDEIYSLVFNCSQLQTNLMSSDIISFFKILKRVPHASSFLYDFSYWRENKLISTSQYNDIINRIENQLRNINLKTMIYTPSYLTILSKLKTADTTANTYMARIAAEDESNANYTSDATLNYSFYNLADTTISSGSTFYKIFSGTIDVINNSGYSYGSIDSTLLNYCLPAFNDFKNIPTANQVYYVVYYNIQDSNNKSYIMLDSTFITNYDDDNQLFDIDLSQLSLNSLYTYNITIYCKSTGTFINNQSITNLDELTNVRISQYESDLLNQLWTDEYIVNQFSIYGSDWLNTKIEELENTRSEKQESYDTYWNLLCQLIGRTDLSLADMKEVSFLNTIQNNSAIYPKFAYYEDKLENLQTYLGGNGTRVNSSTNSYYTFKGRLQHQIDCWKMLQETTRYKNIQSTYNSHTGLYEILYGNDGLQVQQNNWWKQFYKDYYWVIRETNYSDTTQLTVEGLYGAAYNQFYSYKTTAKSYSASFINSNALLDTNIDIKIGDIIQINQPQIFNKVSDNKFILQLNKFNYNIKDLIKLSNGKDTLSITIDDVVVDNYYYLIYCHTRSSITDYTQYNKLWVNGVLYRIISIIPQKESEPIKLNITGITYDLRSNINQLTVEEHSIVKTLVDKILNTFN